MPQDFRIMVRCPATGKALDTGITTSGREALNSSLFDEGSVACDYCGELHSFQDHGFVSVEGADGADPLWRPNP
jgi:hypothetical protein